MTLAIAAGGAARPARPYPGLRPFEANEWPIFFGRERMIDDVIARLASHRLIVIHGASGSGKSSLVRAGVLPKLARQYLRHGAPWMTCAMRPSGGPLWNLATELARFEARADDPARIEAIVAAFSRRNATLASVFGACPGKGGEGMMGKSLCILVDQFEELFRFEKETSREEAELFIDLLSRAAVRDEAGAPEPAADVRVVVTMRSEFLGECARFSGLAETINLTQYLVPRMDDEAIQRAVLRPAQIYRGEVPRPLADRLIASVRGREDELPVLQHGLMLLWEEAAGKAAPGQRIVLDGAPIEAAGGLAGLLSAHADAVMAAAAPDEGRARKVELLFRELTDVNAEGSAIRRPRSFRDLLAVIGGPPEDLRAILDAFRAPGVSFLAPYAPAPILDATVVDISHEALIRCWRRIAAPDGWLKQEFDDGLAWRSLRAEADAFTRDCNRVLSPAATKERSVLAEARNDAWSRRYDGGWGTVDALLRASRQSASDAERAKREQVERLKEHRRKLLFVTFTMVILAGLIGYFAWITKQALDEARKSEVEARISEDKANVSQANSLAGFATALVNVNPSRAVKLALTAWPRRTEDQRPKRIRVAKALGEAVVQLRERRVFRGHGAHCFTAVFSPDGATILTASADGKARLWDAKTGRLVMSLGADAGGHKDSLRSAAFSPDGTRIVTGSSDRTAIIWETATGRVLAKLSGHEGEVRSAVFSANGARILTASQDRTLRLWDVSPDRLREAEASRPIEPLTVMRGHERQIWRASMSPDGTRAASASDDGTARLWDLATGAQLAVLSGHLDAVTDVGFSPDGTLLATASTDQTVRLWDAATAREIGILSGHDGAVTSAAFSPDGTQLVTTSWDRTARVWEIATRAQIAALRGHDNRVWSAAFSPDGTSVATASADKTARLWNNTPGRRIAALPNADGRLFSVVFSRDGLRLLATSKDSLVRIWDVATGNELAVLRGHSDLVRRADFSLDGTLVVTASWDHTARIWDAATGQQRAELRGHSDHVESATFSPDGRLIATTSSDHTARIWNVETHLPVAILEGHTESVWTAAFSPDGTRLVTASKDRTARVWDLATGKTIAVLRGHTSGVLDAVFSPDGRQLLTSSGDATMRIWDVPPQQAAASAESAPPKSVAILRGHLDPVTAAAYSQDGTRIVSASTDRTARLWDVATREQIVVLRGHQEVVWNAALSPDGHIATASADRTVRLWNISNIPPGNLFQVACGLLPDHDLTDISRDYDLADLDPICEHEVPLPEPEVPASP